MTLTVLIYLEVRFETKGVKIQVAVDVFAFEEKIRENKRSQNSSQSCNFGFEKKYGKTK